MITLKGFWFDGQSSAQIPAQLRITELGQVQVCHQADKQILQQGRFCDLEVSSRLGNTPRYLQFADGQKFETLDNDSVDRANAMLNPGRWQNLVHRLESRMHFVFLTLVVVIAFGWGVVNYGVPLTAKVVAHALPQNVLTFASEQTMAALDGTFFSPSTLDDPVKQRVREHFRAAVDQHPQLNLKVLFRDGGRIGANAMALPDGTVVFTDQMVELAERDDELLAVFAHEIGHIVHRHGMRSVVQDSVLAFLLVTITGDASATAEIFLALPVILTELAYSRDFEREADDYALDYLQTHNIPSENFSQLMARLESAARAERDKASAQPKGQNGEKPWRNYLSSHPSTAERLKKFKN